MNSGTSIPVEGLTNGTEYEFWVVAIDQNSNPSEPTRIGSATPQPAKDLWELYKDKGGKADGGYCFVATAAYGNYHHPQVQILRQFRDQVLLKSEAGADFVRWYYQRSPALASWITQHPYAQDVSRALLWPVTLAAGAHLYTTAWQKTGLLVVTMIMAFFLYRRLRRRRGAGRAIQQGECS
jgi:hypothetical protein